MRVKPPASSTAKHTLTVVQEMDVNEVESWMLLMSVVEVRPMRTAVPSRVTPMQGWFAAQSTLVKESWFSNVLLIVIPVLRYSRMSPLRAVTVQLDSDEQATDVNAVVASTWC